MREDGGRFDREILDDGDGAAVPGAGSALDVRAATIAGDIGGVTGIHDDAPLVRGWAYDGYASVDVHTTLPDGSASAMTILGVTGGLNGAEIRPGAHFELDRDTPFETGAVYMTLIGCSGPADGNWDFDQSSDTLVVDVREGSQPGTVVIDTVATFPLWDDGVREDQVVIGSVEVGQTRAE